MTKLCKALEDWGCDIKGAMRRFLNDEELYQTCLFSIITDENFELLGQALNKKSLQESFDCAHTLKGIIGNMGLTPMYDIAVSIVEPLRVGEMEDFSQKYKALLESRRKLEEIVEQNKQ